MSAQHSVLIVDRSEETREVLQTVLERRGVRTLSADRTDSGLDLARRHQPDLIVLDLELDGAEVAEFSQSSRSRPVSGTNEAEGPQMVLLGNLRGWRGRRLDGEFVSKPYHYAPLVRKIEEMLADATRWRLGDGPHLPSSAGEPRETKLCRRCSSFAAPIREAASN